MTLELHSLALYADITPLEKITLIVYVEKSHMGGFITGLSDEALVSKLQTLTNLTEERLYEAIGMLERKGILEKSLSGYELEKPIFDFSINIARLKEVRL